MIKKEIKKYNEKYGEVPKNFLERISYAINQLNVNMKDMIKIREAIPKLIHAKWEEYNFVVYFFPKATPRPRSSGRTNTFYVKNAADYNKFFKEFIEAYDGMRGIITTPTKFVSDLYMPIPDNMPKVIKILAELKLVRPLSKPDWDNAGKTYSDMVQKYLVLDDSLIVDGRTRKYYSFKPRIEINIDYMENYDCKYNKQKVEGWKTYAEMADKIEEKDFLI